MPIQDKTTRFSYLLIIGFSLLVFVIDALTPLGYAEWILYVLPVALTSAESKPQLPYITAAGLAPLLVLGYQFSPDGTREWVAIFNRSVALFSVFGVAYLSRRIILERLISRRLMWLERGREVVSHNILGELSVQEAGDNILHGLAKYMEAQVATLYRVQGDHLELVASYALDKNLAQQAIAFGNGLPGEVARDGKPMLVKEVPADYLPINSAVGRSNAVRLLIAPFSSNGHVDGIIEMGFFRSDALEEELGLLGLVSERIGSALQTAQYRQNLKNLLDETQRQSEELQTQQEELRVVNEELAEQAKALQESQTQLEMQHSELEQANVRLEERSELLEQQKRQLLKAQQAVEKNVVELERANQYKSEFLANMSHELRTPLNSSLILSHMLAENKSGTLTDDQVRYARTINDANKDLLALINDILDLSKIESGQVELRIEPIFIKDVVDSLQQIFEPIAAQKSLNYRATVHPEVPDTLNTDGQRLQQILKNLLSNAFKFTDQGEVELSIALHDDKLRFSVRDTGIGIPPEQQDVIFEAFRQADGSTSRTYGGTGLGLSISRELALLLNGKVSVASAAGKGSTFTVEVPLMLEAESTTAVAKLEAVSVIAEAKSASRKVSTPAESSAAKVIATPAEPQFASSIPDDRDRRSRDRLILVIEDDENFAHILYEMAHEMNFDCIHASNGAEAISLAEKHMPNGILLDVGLPDQSGLSVLEKIKRNPSIRHLPVHIISVDDYMQAAYEMGAIGYALKPAAREDLVKAIGRLESVLNSKARRVLIVEDNAPLRESLSAMLAAEDIEITNAGSVAEALDKLSSLTFDCMVMDLMLPDGSGYDLLEEISKGGKYAFPPVIVYTGRVLSRDEEQKLRRYSHSIIIKGARSPERLLDEVTLFLHRVESTLPPEQQKLLAQARQRDSIFEGRRILVAEDDVRNVFALTSIFEPLGATLIIARDGEEALRRIQEDERIDLVLMDLMMPKMDGLTATRKLREQPQFKKLPIIALTAKAMADDRRNSLEAGASDYIAKPINVDQLVSLCRVWMPK
jgi:CheY-like chemotaxis protein/signal transduction histidine kinase